VRIFIPPLVDLPNIIPEDRINRALHQWILEKETKHTPAPLPATVRSPWADVLGNCDSATSDEDDSDDDTVVQLDAQTRLGMQLREISVN
jgi:hypothetical protein